MTTARRMGALVAGAVAAVVLAPAAAWAGQIDNDGPEDVYAYFNCGVACGGVLSIKSGSSVATGRPGYVHAGFPINPEVQKSPWICEAGNFVSVNDGGEIGVAFNWGAKDANGDPVTANATFTWASKSGYDPAFHAAHGVQSFGGDGSYCWGSHW